MSRLEPCVPCPVSHGHPSSRHHPENKFPTFHPRRPPMATRDRTALFLRYRSEAQVLHQRRKPDVHPPFSSEPQPPLETPQVRRAAMQPDWVFTYNELAGDFAELHKLLIHLTALYAKHLLPSFGESDTTQLEAEIRVSSHRLTNLLHQVEQKVRNVSSQTRGGGGAKSEADKVELVIRRNVQKRFATPLQELSLSFRKKQKSYLHKLNEQREAVVGPQNSAFSLIDHSEEQEFEAYEGAFSETQLLTVENANALAEERTRELSRVAENVNDLATLVKDIASLVVDQGTVLDRVDYNLEEVKLDTFGGLRQLKIANRYQRKRHALCCIILLSVACGIMFTILVLKWTG